MGRVLLLPLLIALQACRRYAPPPAIPATPPDPTAITATLNDYYKHDRACLWITSVRIPHDYAANLGPALDLFRAPAAAGLLTTTPTGPNVHVALTPLGQASWQPDPQQPAAGNLCYSTPQVASIDALHPVIDPFYGPVVQVDFTTTTSSHTPWADNPAIAAASPAVHLELTTPRPGTATVRFTAERWQVAGANVHADIAPDFSLAN